MNTLIVEGKETFAGKLLSGQHDYCFLKQVTHMQEDDIQQYENVQKNVIFYVDFRKCKTTETDQTK
ncbi:MAG: hypothetical protein IJ846_05595 [Alphaproteobacteria bacterium]|nr:hypothetical protein [Alphaproteobacteria bacterium]